MDDDEASPLARGIAGPPAESFPQIPRGREMNGLLRESWRMNHDPKL